MVIKNIRRSKLSKPAGTSKVVVVSPSTEGATETKQILNGETIVKGNGKTAEGEAVPIECINTIEDNEEEEGDDEDEEEDDESDDDDDEEEEEDDVDDDDDDDENDIKSETESKNENIDISTYTAPKEPVTTKFSWASVASKPASTTASSLPKPAVMVTSPSSSIPSQKIKNDPSITNISATSMHATFSDLNIIPNPLPPSNASSTTNNNNNNNNNNIFKFPTEPLKSVPSVQQRSDYSHANSSSRILSNTNNNTSNIADEDDDDGEGWITPNNINICRANGSIALDTSVTTSKTNINSVVTNNGVTDAPITDDSAVGWSDPVSRTARKKHTNRKSNTNNKNTIIDPKSIKVACITTDFSMQNVMLQIGLHLMSIDGMLIQKVKQWVLRCVMCYQIHYDLTRLFCSKCGGNYLTRVAVSINKDTGKLKLHLKSNYQYNLRGTIYSLPKPGKSTSSNSKNKYKGELLLREDQLLTGVWKQKQINSQRKAKLSSSGLGDIFSDCDFGVSKVHHMNDIIVGFGKKNPNSMKGRERRGKKKS